MEISQQGIPQHGNIIKGNTTTWKYHNMKVLQHGNIITKKYHNMEIS